MFFDLRVIYRRYFCAFDPRRLRDEQILSSQAHGRSRRESRSRLCGKRGDGRVADQEHVEVLREVLVSRGRRADAHIRVISGQ